MNRITLVGRVASGVTPVQFWTKPDGETDTYEVRVRPTRARVRRVKAGDRVLVTGALRYDYSEGRQRAYIEAAVIEIL